MKRIENYAFYDCRGLKAVHSMIEQPFAINDDVFQYYDNGYKFTSATLYVPADTKSKYQATNGWKNFTNIVEEEPEFDLKKCDVNGDGNINVADITEIIRAIANIQQLNESGMYPAYFGRVQLARQTTTLNETKDGYIYVISIQTMNGYVVPGLIRPGATKIEWHLEAAEKITGSNKYNSAFYLSSENKWVNCTAHDVYTADYLIWYSGTVEYGRISFEDCEKLNWDLGYKKDGHWTVYTSRYKLEFSNGYLYITDTVTGSNLGKYGTAK